MIFEDIKQNLRSKTGDEYPNEDLEQVLKTTTEGVDVVSSDNIDSFDNEEIDRGG